MNDLRGLVLAGAVVLTAVCGFAAQPNILWIITDDQRADSLSCFNQADIGQADSKLGYVHSPNVDRMAERGVIFSQAYCNAPVCGATRASMHMGTYPHHSGRYAFESSHQKSDVTRITVPQVLRGLGYTAASFGKGGHLIKGDLYDAEVEYGEMKKNGVTDFSKSSKRKPGEWGPASIIYSKDIFYTPEGPEEMFYEKAGGLSPDEQARKDRIENKYDILRAYTRELSSLIVGGVSPQPMDKTMDGEIYHAFETYLNHVDSEYETSWGKKMTGPKSDQPLFTHLSFCLPHTPVMPPQEFRDLFKDKVYDIPDFSKTEMNRMPEWVRNISIKMNFVDMTPEDQQQAVRDYYAFCAFGDYLIGKAAERFKTYSEKQGRGWLIVYVAGDHGWHLGEQGTHGKFAPWTSSTRGAVVVESSDKTLYPASGVCKKRVEYVDFATTFFKVAGLKNAKEKHPHLDGVPLDETLHGNVEERPYVWTELNHVTGPWACMRTKDFMFGMKTRPYYNYPPAYQPNQNVMWGLEAPLEKVEPILYDLRVDAAERVNMAEVEEYAELVKWFRTKVGTIALGDGRVEVNWKADNEYNISNFAPGADDKKLDIPRGFIPGPERARHIYTREYELMLSGK
ncbi:sulfatase-like hydrolase/transferase [Pontiellaceae bacterium B12227]|nr:sulfatase-like hydrolase/transferase [Pontiellaceae bacterium B12227]